MTADEVCLGKFKPGNVKRVAYLLFRILIEKDIVSCVISKWLCDVKVNLLVNLFV